MLTRGYSQTEIEEHLHNAAKLLDGQKLPKKWNDVLKILKELGYHKSNALQSVC